MSSTSPPPRKRKRGINVDFLEKLFGEDPPNYEIAWHDIKNRISKAKEQAQQELPSVSFSGSSVY